jgi:cytochrome c oxidase cbb3-type subunit 3
MGGAGPDLTDDKWIYGGSDGDLFTTVSGGRKGGMPSWKGQLKDEEIWKVISYVRSLKKK